MPIYTFLNGTAEQKELWRMGPSLMLNLPVDSLGLTIEVEFVDPSTLNTQTTLAETTWNYDDAHSTCKVRNDFPALGGGDGKLQSMEATAASMGLRYSTAKHCLEIPVHELGHSLFASLPEATRLKLVALFGGTSDDNDAINNEDALWQNRIVEGIAETFKEAFLPARYRVFPNRTNLILSYRDYPEFRRLFRRASGDSTNDFCYLYGSDSFRVDFSKYDFGFLPVHQSDRDPEAFVEYQASPNHDYQQGWGVQMDQFKEAGKLPFTIELEGGIEA